MGIFNGNDQWFTSIYEDPKKLLISSNIQQGPSGWIRPHLKSMLVKMDPFPE